jgi:molybdopterin-guanine dinucleotide biosynthesis protein A
MEGTGACLIAGGKSRRMGRDKRFLPLGGVPLISRELGLLQTLFEEVIIVLAEPSAMDDMKPYRIVYDAIANCGSLGGLYTGLIQTASSRVFAVAADMPFLNADVVTYLVKYAPEADVVGVKVGKDLQPLHAVYSKRCIPVLFDMATSGKLCIRGLFEDSRLDVRIVPDEEIADRDPAYLSFRNINTPQDYELAQESLARSSVHKSSR